MIRFRPQTRPGELTPQRLVEVRKMWCATTKIRIWHLEKAEEARRQQDELGKELLVLGAMFPVSEEEGAS